MTSREIAEQLANPARTVAAIALALLEARGRGLGETDVEQIRVMVDRLCDHDLEIDAILIPRVMVALAALAAAKTGTSPQAIFEQLWKDAPTDAWWRERTQARPTNEEDTK